MEKRIAKQYILYNHIYFIINITHIQKIFLNAFFKWSERIFLSVVTSEVESELGNEGEKKDLDFFTALI